VDEESFSQWEDELVRDDNNANSPTRMAMLLQSDIALHSEATSGIYEGEIQDSYGDRELSESSAYLTGDRKQQDFRLMEEAKKLFHIALPSVLIQFSLFLIFPVSASVVGRKLGTVELGGFSLGSLLGNLTCLSIMEGALTAADTLMPRAYGSRRYDEVARLVIRAVVALTLLLVPPILPLCSLSAWILTSLGQDKHASRLAQEWIRIYFLGVPPNLVFRVAMRFLLSQHAPWPLVYSSVIPCVFVHPILLHVLVAKMGLAGSALAITLTQWTMMVLLAGYFIIRRNDPPYKPETWPGLSRKLIAEALRPRQLLQFFSLSVGGVFSLSEWWFWETMCFIAGSFGVVALCAHTIAYNLVPLLFMLPLGIMVGLTVRIGHVIAFDPRRAKLMAAWSMGFIIVTGTLVASMLYVFRLEIILMFSTDDEVVRMSMHIFPDLCGYTFLIYIFGISSAIYRGLGMQWRLASIVTTLLYLFLLPAVVYFAMIKQGGLYKQWRLLPLFYTFMQVVLIFGFVTVDWDEHSRKIRDGLRRSLLHSPSRKPRAKSDEKNASETSRLLNP